MVTHDPDAVLRHLDRPERLVAARRVARVEVRVLLQGRAVDLDRAGALALHGVTADCDDPLDQVLLLGRRHQADEAEDLLDRVGLGGGHLVQPAARVVEDDNLATFRFGAEPGGELVHEHPVAALQGVLHRVGRNGERLHQERLDDQREDQRDPDEDRQLFPEGTRLLALLHAAALLLVHRLFLVQRHSRARRPTGAGRLSRIRRPCRVRRSSRHSGRGGLCGLTVSRRLFGLFGSGPRADRQVPHIHSLLHATACPIAGAGPPLP